MSKLALALTYSQALSHVLSQRIVLVQVGLPCVVARARLCLCCGGEAVGGGSNGAVFKPSPYGIHIYTVRTSNVFGREGRILSTSVPQNHQDKVGFRMRDLIREWKREREREFTNANHLKRLIVKKSIFWWRRVVYLPQCREIELSTCACIAYTYKKIIEVKFC